MLVSLIFAFPAAKAFSPDIYAEKSALAQGRWVKIHTQQSGVYRLSASTLRRMGFQNPSKVRIYGYGGAQTPDRLSPQMHADDLPLIPTLHTPGGNVVFYAQGPYEWTSTSGTRATRNNNLYTNRRTYFVTEVPDSVAPLQPAQMAAMTPGTPATTITGRVHHEKDAETIGQCGPQLVGEEFRYTPNRALTLQLPGCVDDTEVQLAVSFVAKTFNQPSQLSITTNSAGTLAPALSIPSTVNDSYYFGSEGQRLYTFSHSGEKLTLALQYTSPVTIGGAWLNYLTATYQRHSALPQSGHLEFWSDSFTVALAGASENTVVWDVTEPQAIRQPHSQTEGGTLTFTTPYSGTRAYVAFNPDAALPEPTIGTLVATQNLHGITQADMVIVAPRIWQSQAKRIAQMHADDPLMPLNVVVVDPEDVYNEFSSGEKDPSALRWFFKMLYDRGEAQGRPLRYALLMGRTTHDPAHLTAEMAKVKFPTIPAWFATALQTSLSEKSGFPNDDFMAMLADNSGLQQGSDQISIALGRMPVTSLEEATQDVDKLIDYATKSKPSGWKNNILVLADDGDNGTHLQQAESFSSLLTNNSGDYTLNKVYMDAYPREGSSYPQARQDMFRLLNEGTLLWVFLGHGSPLGWTHDGQLTFSDINSLYHKNIPVLYAGTCSFNQWDRNSTSGAEILAHERFGGTIATITATRPVYISDNALFTEAMGRALAKRDGSGNLLRIGDYYRLAKNDIRDPSGRPTSNTNRLRYTLMGDPAMALAKPSNRIELLSINGVAAIPDGEEQAIIPALGQPLLTGRVTDPMGNTLDTFNGTVALDLYDAEHSTTSFGHGKEGAKITFEQHGSKLYSGVIPVVNGLFTGKIAMPAEIADNFRPAMAAMYAVDTNTGTEAAGVNSNFYVFGFDNLAASDTVPPVIEQMYLNHPTFTEGQLVNNTPTLLATVSDNVAVNISSQGVGHKMTAVLDGKKTISDIATYYTPAPDGSSTGTLSVPLAQLTDGPHELTLRIWDTSGNAAQRTIAFHVGPESTPKIYRIYSDTNPATTHANFMVETDRPDQMVTVTITVYNLLGRPLWSRVVTGRTDMFTSTPVVWNLNDNAGRRVQRGIYLYRATVSDAGGQTYDTGAQRIAVTNP